MTNCSNYWCVVSVCFSSVLPLRTNQNLPCASWRLMISAFFCESSITGVPNLSLTMYPFNISTDEHVPLNSLQNILSWLITALLKDKHWWTWCQHVFISLPLPDSYLMMKLLQRSESPRVVFAYCAITNHFCVIAFLECPCDMDHESDAK